MARIHILGASGSGTTTLGMALADKLGCPHQDSDTYFWLPTDPPYTRERDSAERMALLWPQLEGLADWVFSGSAMNWAMKLEPLYDLVVFLHVDPAIRMHRLHQREHSRYGVRIQPGGDMEAVSRTFLAWAASYDTGAAQRNLSAHERWLSARRCPVLRLDSSAPVPELTAKVLAAISLPSRDR